MATVEETLTTLQEMGFSEGKAKKALSQTGWKGVEPAMEWLLSHPDEDSDMEEEEAEDGAVAAPGPDEPPPPPPKVLTEEEKKEQMAKLEELRVKKRQERLEREKKESFDKEKRRVTEGKAITGLKQELEEQEMKKIAAERRREKLETQQAKERVKAQIADDRAARKARDAAERGEVVVAAAKPTPPSAAPVVAEPRSYDETRIQIRQTDGKPLVQTFKVKEPLSAVRLYVQLNRKDLTESEQPAKLMMTFPRKVFSDDDYDVPLEALGLVPSASLVIMK